MITDVAMAGNKLPTIECLTLAQTLLIIGVTPTSVVTLRITDPRVAELSKKQPIAQRNLFVHVCS